MSIGYSTTLCINWYHSKKIPSITEIRLPPICREIVTRICHPQLLCCYLLFPHTNTVFLPPYTILILQIQAPTSSPIAPWPQPFYYPVCDTSLPGEGGGRLCAGLPESCFTTTHNMSALGFDETPSSPDSIYTSSSDEQDLDIHKEIVGELDQLSLAVA